MKKILNDYSIELDKILKDYQDELSKEEKEEVVRYINILEENLHLFVSLMKNKKNIKDMLSHISEQRKK